MKNGFLTRFVATFLVSAFCLLPTQAETTQGAEEKKKTSGKKPMVTVKHTTLYKNSHIIVNRGAHTIIPKRSILFLPERIKTRVVEKPTGTFVLWPTFKRNNQDWIWTYEVTLDQAKGITPMPEGKIKDFAKLNRMVVALYRGNPVSVLPPKQDSTKDSTNKK